MVLQRRRHHERVVVAAGVLGVTAISAAALCVFMISAFLTVLVPPLLDHHAFPNPPDLQRRGRRSSILLGNTVEKRRKVLGGDIFSVPREGDVAGGDLWESKRSKYFYGCSNATEEFEKAVALTNPNRYLMISTSGGLNQQRTGIIDAVVVARILNATLIVPTLDQKSFWKDSSNFLEVFDIEWFISSLSEDVKITKELPMNGGNVVATPYRMRVPRKCTPRCYQSRILPALMRKHVVHLTKFDYRLSNKLENNLQKLRCRVNYHALRFAAPIRRMGETLIKRMRSKAKHFIALHLRFEPDMLAFSGCYYGGGEKERLELGAIRKRWKNLHASNPEKERRQGRCPLTPEEVGLMLRALGYGNEVHVYAASGEVYGGDRTLAPLKALFPNFHSKETLAKEELAPFSPFSSRMAALDYIVCDESDVFVTNNNGNMAKMLAGRRRYFGHKRTIRPNTKKLHTVYRNRTAITWDAFESKIRTFQKGFMGEPNEVRPGRGEFHENPSACLCEAAGEGFASPNIQPRTELKTARASNLSRTGSESGDQGRGWDEWDYVETTPLGKVMQDTTNSEYDRFLKNEDPDFEEFSD